MKREAYAAARTISPRLHAYFARHRDEALRHGTDRVASLPEVETVEALIDAAFWASLRREEGYNPRVSMAFLSPAEARRPLVFERPLLLGPTALTKVAAAVERPGMHLGVWRNSGDLCVWGATRDIPALCFVLEVSAPGLLVIKFHNREESRKFINVAVLEGDQIKLVDENAASRSDAPPLLRSLLQFDSPLAEAQAWGAMAQLAVSMRAHGRGGILLIVPANDSSWRESIVEPMSYAVSPPFVDLACLVQKTPNPDDPEAWTRSLAPAVAEIGGLTAVDGAVVLNSRLEVLGFGAKIARRRGWPGVEEVVVTEPIEGSAPAFVHPEQLGGTRHFSAAQFVHDQRDSMALVASQDGRFTVFAWSHAESKVHANRVESLLL